MNGNSAKWRRFSLGGTNEHGREWDGVLYRLEAVRTREDAREAANALRALLEAEDLLVVQSDQPR